MLNITPEEEKVLNAITPVHRFNVSPFDVMKELAPKLPEGWGITFDSGGELPPHRVAIGTVKVRHGDPSFNLYVYRKGE